MPSKRFTDREKKLVRARAQQDRRFERELDKDTRVYREAVRQAIPESRQRGERLRTVVAEGDSWFYYPVGRSITFTVERHDSVALLNLARHGDEGKHMLGMTQRDRLERVLRSGPSRGRKFDVLMFSAGGNDLLGQGAFRYWLNPYQPGMSASDVLNTNHLKHIFGIIDMVMRELFALRDEVSPNTRIYLNAYDFAQATGKGVCGLGPWLEPSLKHRGVPRPLHNDVVRVLLEKYEQRLRRHATAANNARVIETQGILDADDWANEIHPRNRGFREIAQKFTDALDEEFPIRA